MARRSRGEGAIYQRKDGIWVAQYRDGSNKRKYLYGKNRQVVTDKLKETQRVLGSGGEVRFDPISMNEYLADWLRSVGGTVRERTHQRYEGLVRLHVTPSSGRSTSGT